MTTTSSPMRGETTPAGATGRSRSRQTYTVLATIFWIGVLAQGLLAGAGIFVSGDYMQWHQGLGHCLSSPIPLIPLFLIILSFPAKLPRTDKWLAVLLFVLALIQPVFLYMRGVFPAIAALHPANAMLLFALPLYMVARARRVPGSTTTSH